MPGEAILSAENSGKPLGGRRYAPIPHWNSSQRSPDLQLVTRRLPNPFPRTSAPPPGFRPSASIFGIRQPPQQSSFPLMLRGLGKTPSIHGYVPVTPNFWRRHCNYRSVAFAENRRVGTDRYVAAFMSIEFRSTSYYCDHALRCSYTPLMTRYRAPLTAVRCVRRVPRLVKEPVTTAIRSILGSGKAWL